LGPKGAPIAGHEFHHSELLLDEDVEFAIRLERGTGIKEGWDGISDENLIASYTHLHSASYRGFPANFLSACREHKG
jgi:cobyrinic acid a,c-diamide synthase